MARLILLLAVLTFPVTAHAIPVVIAAIAYGASSFATYLGASAAAAAFYGAVAAIAASAVIANNTKPGRQQELPTFQSEAKDRQSVVRSSVEPRRVIYGRVAVSGPLVYAESTGSNNEFLHIVIPLASHEVEAIDEVYFNDEILPLDTNGLALGRWAKFGAATVPTTVDLTMAFAPPYHITLPETVVAFSSVQILGDDGLLYGLTPTPNIPGPGQFLVISPTEIAVSSFAQQVGGTVRVSYFKEVAIPGGSYVRVKKHLGATDQVADADLVAESGGNWTANHRLRGIAYLYVRLEWSPDVFPTGVPNIKAVVRGKKVLDPRTSPATTAWSENWALCVRDYLTSDYGLGCDEDEIDDSLIIAAANIADEDVDLDGSPPTATQARYTANGTVNLSDRPVDILRQLVSAGAGVAVFTEGVWKVYAGAYNTPTIDIDEDWLRGPVKVRAKPPRRELFNGVRGVIANSYRFWQPTDFPPVKNSTYATQDGGEILRDLELPFTTEPIAAQRIAKIHLEAGRQGLIAELPCNLRAFEVATWDTVRVSIERLGWVNKVFRVLEWKFSPEGGIDLVVKEETAAIYDWAFGNATEVDLAPDTELQSPFTEITITAGTPVSGTSELFIAGDGTVVPRIRLPFTQPANPFIRYYEVQFARSSESPQLWQDAPDLTAPADQAYFFPVDDGVAYDGRIRAVTGVGNAGPWAFFYAHTVIGKTAVPSDVTGASAVQTGGLVIMGCNVVEDADLDAVEVRLHDEDETDYDDATPIANILRGETVTSAALPPGTWELLFKAKDTSGNYSLNAARVTITVTAEGFTQIEQEPQAVDWVGMKTNMVQHWTGVLTPDSQSLASALGWEVFDEFVPNAYTDCYYEAPVIDKAIDATARIYGDIVSVLGPGEGGVAAPKLEVDHRTSAGSFDGFEVWTVGAANFRYFKARIHVDTTIGKPVISQFTPTIDAEARVESGTLTVGAGGSGALAFGIEFHDTPVLQVTPQGSGDVSASYDSLTAAGFTGFFKTAGVGSAGSMSYVATGA